MPLSATEAGRALQSTRRSLSSALIALTAAFGRRTPFRSAPVVEIRQASASSGLLATILGASSSALSREGALEQAASNRAPRATVPCVVRHMGLAKPRTMALARLPGGKCPHWRPASPEGETCASHASQAKRDQGHIA